MVGLEDLTERLTLIRRQEELEEQLQELKSREKLETVVFACSREIQDITRDDEEGQTTTIKSQRPKDLQGLATPESLTLVDATVYLTDPR